MFFSQKNWFSAQIKYLIELKESSFLLNSGQSNFPYSFSNPGPASFAESLYLLTLAWCRVIDLAQGYFCLWLGVEKKQRKQDKPRNISSTYFKCSWREEQNPIESCTWLWSDFEHGNSVAKGTGAGHVRNINLFCTTGKSRQSPLLAVIPA